MDSKKLSLMEVVKIIITKGHEFHLYAYDKIDNIPNNCIIKNGNEIISEKEIFYYDKSATKDGISVNTISAFSNLFRYKLLYEKGILGRYGHGMYEIFKFKDDYVFSSEEVYIKIQ